MLHLVAFTAQEAEFFYGRSQERHELLDRVRQSAFVAVVGASGSGNACVQVASALVAEVAATVGSTEKIETARSAGAQLVINYNERNFADAILDWTDGVGVDVVIDNVGASVFEDPPSTWRASP